MLSREKIMARRFNCCIFNHPVPICCPFVNLDCTENTVVNPVLGGDFAFFNNTVGGDFVSQSLIPVGLVQSNGVSIVPNGNTGSVVLTPGSYEVNYFAGGNVPASGTMSIKLQLNGVDVDGSIINGTQDSGDAINLTRTVTLFIPQTSILGLINNSSDTTTHTFASMFIRKL